MTLTLERRMVSLSRAGEYFDPRELQAQTGQPVENFASVVLKELCDNALDAAESAQVAPILSISLLDRGDLLTLSVGDNGSGLAPETVERILDFSSRTSDKSVHRTPTRGAQGNALKTVIGIPHALGGSGPITIAAGGVCHTIVAGLDLAGEPRLDHQREPIPDEPGTVVSVALRSRWDEDDFQPDHWARAYALLNPHALVQIRHLVPASEQANSWHPTSEDLYQPTVAFPVKGGWRKFLPTDLPSPWWYDGLALSKQIGSYNHEARRDGKDLTLREFVRRFRGLSRSAEAKSVTDHFSYIKRLTDFDERPNRIADLLARMRAVTTPPKQDVLGIIGEDHFRARFDEWYGVKRIWHRARRGVVGDVPFIVEVAVAETERESEGALYTGVNFSPTFEDPFANTPLSTDDVSAFGLNNFLRSAHASPIPRWGQPPAKTAVAVHLTCPALEFLDRGKTRLRVPPKMAQEIAAALWDTCKTLYKEAKRREKDAAAAARADRVC